MPTKWSCLKEKDDELKMTCTNEKQRFRIVLVNTYHYFGGGDSTYTFNLANLLQGKGHVVYHFAMHSDRNLADPNSDLFVTHIDFKELNRHKTLGTGVATLARVVYSREAESKFFRLLDRVEPDIVHLQNIHAHITPSVIFQATKRCLPVLWTLHDYRLICPNSHFFIDETGEICEACKGSGYHRAIWRKCKKGSRLASGMAALETYIHGLIGVKDCVDAFLCPSGFLKNKMVEHGLAARKLHHVPLFVPDQMFNDSSSDPGGYLLYMGKIEPIKGIHTLLKACRKAPHCRVVMAGRIEEPLASELPGLLPDNATYVGMKSGDDLARLIKGAMAILVPSLWYENQPFTILEAFAAGKPVVATDLGGMKELIEHGQRGFLVPPDDAEALADAMSRISGDSRLAMTMGANARAYAGATHHSSIHYARIMSLYAELVSRSGGRRSCG